jgi:primosomal protein N' (replication factor Y) (superfamily II helicase)
MQNQPILRLALPTPLRRLFDYRAPEGIDYKSLIPGIRVRVPFQSRTLVGILVEVVSSSSLPYGKLKTAFELIDTEALLPHETFKFCQWAADYYHYSLGEVLASALPTLLRKGRPALVKKKSIASVECTDEPWVLNAAQKQAVDEITAASHDFKPFLLEGVTGSGKTEVYLHAILPILKQGKQALVLVPEISLTPQTIQRFRARFREPIVALHSALSETERLRAWLAAQSGEAKIVIGTRSAIFTPMPTLGLIIVDEEHDSSFKQQDRFRYHARDLAVMRANLQRIPVVLGSATPSLESLLNVKRQRYVHLSLPLRAGKAIQPCYQVIDLRQSPVEQGLSPGLLKAMQEHLAQGNQVLLFLNRRGFAPVLYCTQCRWIAVCTRCDARMVYHQKPTRLQCHHCDARHPLPSSCSQCGSVALQPVGLGTQRLQETLEKHFPEVPIIRIDRDNTRLKGAMQELLSQIHEQKKAILLGTQMLAKGHHFPHVTLVGIVDADSGLLSADFRAAEQMGQLLLQVGGRAGRAEKPGSVVIQTRHPDHALLQTLIYEGYQPYSEVLLSERKDSHLPPYSYFAVFRAEAYSEQHAHRFLTQVKAVFPAMDEELTMLGPVPALIAKRKGLHCQHLIVKANRRPMLQECLKIILQEIEKWPRMQAVKWVLDVDPVDV